MENEGSRSRRFTPYRRIAAWVVLLAAGTALNGCIIYLGRQAGIIENEVYGPLFVVGPHTSSTLRWTYFELCEGDTACTCGVLSAQAIWTGDEAMDFVREGACVPQPGFYEGLAQLPADGCLKKGLFLPEWAEPAPPGDTLCPAMEAPFPPVIN